MARPPSDTGTRPGTRERLLDAADRLMWARGYEAVGVAELCAEAGAPRGSFYHWWPSKQALAAAMLRMLQEPALAACCVENGLETAHRYRWEHVIARVETAAQRMLRDGPAQ